MRQKFFYYLGLMAKTDKTVPQIIDSLVSKLRALNRQWRLYVSHRYLPPFIQKRLPGRYAYRSDHQLNRLADEDLLKICGLQKADLVEDQAALFRFADDARLHRFYILGEKRRWTHSPNQYRKFSDDNGSRHYTKIPWCMDVKARYTWPSQVWHHRIAYIPPADIKVPWELSRGQHLLSFGLSHYMRPDPKYYQEFRNQIIDWHESNPFCCGPNWACTMEVGIRIANWLAAALFFASEINDDHAFRKSFFEQIHQHGLYITRHLEKTADFASNHYIGNIAGLYFIGAICPFFTESDSWLKFAQSELEAEIQKQTLSDGLNFESSTSYHRLVLEMFLHCFLVGNVFQKPFSAAYEKTLIKMLSALAAISKPDQTIPQIGDNDSGRFLVSNYANKPDSLDISYLLQIGRDFLALKELPQLLRQGALFHESGRYVFKNAWSYLLIAAGPKGQEGRGGHAHNDVLSFELIIGKTAVFVDPGTGFYTPHPEIRNQLRSVQSHNTLYWPEIEPCDLDYLFLLKETGALNVLKVLESDSQNEFHARYNYNRRWHERRLVLNQGLEESLCIHDRCSHTGAVVGFICAPTCKPEIVADDRIELESAVVRIEGGKVPRLVDAIYSPGYGRTEKTWKIEVPLQDRDVYFEVIPKTEQGT